MGEIKIPGIGGGGIDADGLTALPEHVLSGKVAGVKGYDEGQPGTMPERGDWSSAELPAGASVTVPGGHHSGAGKVTAKSLASQTQGSATAAQIVAPYTATVNGALITGQLQVYSVVSFNLAAYSTNQITATWVNPSKGPYSGVIIRYKAGGYPASVADGTLGYQGVGSNAALGAASSVIIGGLSQGVTYYFCIWAYCNTSVGTWYSGAGYGVCATTAAGQLVFTGSTTWAVPMGVRSVDLFVVGGGQAGGTGNNSVYGNDGGNGGQTNTIARAAVTPGETLNIVVGGGGSGGYETGGDTCIYRGPTLLASALGGRYSGSGVRTGSAGGGGSIANIANPIHATRGASDGRDVIQDRRSPILGQGYTTRAFRESWNSLYSGGGGGGGCRNDYVFGAGGAGGGGAGSGSSNVAGGNGAYGTGGGGGAGYSVGGTKNYPSGSGGSGIALIRWGY